MEGRVQPDVLVLACLSLLNEMHDQLAYELPGLLLSVSLLDPIGMESDMQATASGLHWI